MTAENAEALLKGITIQVAAAVRAQLVTPNEALEVLDDAFTALKNGRAMAASELLFKH